MIVGGTATYAPGQATQPPPPAMRARKHPHARNLANATRLPLPFPRRHLLGLLAAASPSLAGCGGEPAPPPPAPAWRNIPIAPGASFTLPPPSTLGRTVEARQLIAAHYRGQTFVFETIVAVGPDRMLVVGTDSLGRRAMTIAWSGSALTAEAAPWVPSVPRPIDVLAGIVLTHWPDDAVRAGLAPTAAESTPRPGHRVVAVDGHESIAIDRVAGAPGGWTGRWRYRNLGWGYDLDIQSVETAP